VKVPVANDVDFSLETLCFDGQRCIEVIHDELGFMIQSRDLLLNCNVLGFRGQVPFDNVVTVIDRFDGLDFSRLSINICLNARTHEFESFVEEQTTVHHNFIGEGFKPLIRVLSDFDCCLTIGSQQCHDLVGKDTGLPAFHELLLAQFGKSCGRSNFSEHRRQLVHVQSRVPQTSFAFLAMMSSVILFQVLIMLM
jgi:hypothetical protein